MRLLNNPSEQVSKPSWGCLAFMAAIALSVSSCISIQDTDSINQTLQKDEMSECDIDNPVFISLVGIGAELQASINADEENGYTLEYVWRSLRSELEKRTEFRDVSVSIVSPKETERGYMYMELSATDTNGKVWKNWLYGKDKDGADQKIQCLRDNFMLYIKEKVQYMTPSGTSLEKDTITQILQIEKEGFEKHNMNYEVQPDGENWIIVFHYIGEEKFGLICLSEEVE